METKTPHLDLDPQMDLQHEAANGVAPDAVAEPVERAPEPVVSDLAQDGGAPAGGEPLATPPGDVTEPAEATADGVLADEAPALTASEATEERIAAGATDGVVATTDDRPGELAVDAVTAESPVAPFVADAVSDGAAGEPVPVAAAGEATLDASPDGEADAAEVPADVPAAEAPIAGAAVAVPAGEAPAADAPVAEAPAAETLADDVAVAPPIPVEVLSPPVGEGDSPVAGADWGYVDGDGNVWQRAGRRLPPRIVGHATGHNPALALAFYAREFERLAERAATLVTEIERAPNKSTFLSRLQRLREEVPNAEAVGDFDGLLDRLELVEVEIGAEMARRRERKEQLAARAEALRESTEWKSAGDELRALFEEWKAVGPLARDEEQALWERFNSARQAFYSRRSAHFAERDREYGENRARKEALCERAEALKDSTDWKATSDALKGLQAEWKAVGSAGREQDQQLWARFRGAMDVFFTRRSERYTDNKRTKEELCAQAEALSDSTDWNATSATMKRLQDQWKQTGFAGGEEDDALWQRFRRALDAFYSRRSEIYAERDRSYGENLERKEALILEAEGLLAAEDLRGATQRVKTLQEEWKAIGPVPRERADDVWNRFRAACDAVFSRAREQWERRQQMARTNLKDSLDRQRLAARELMESIAHDDELLTRWEDQLNNLRPGGREAEIRRDLEARIASVQERIEVKQRRIEEYLAAIAEMDARLSSQS